MPPALVRKYPRAAHEFAWQYLFPSSRLALDPCRPDEHCRHHVLDSSMQKAMKQAVRLAEINKRASCHTLRHSFAHTPAGIRDGHSHNPGFVGAQGCFHHNDLYTCG